MSSLSFHPLGAEEEEDGSHVFCLYPHGVFYITATTGLFFTLHEIKYDPN